MVRYEKGQYFHDHHDSGYLDENENVIESGPRRLFTLVLVSIPFLFIFLQSFVVSD